MTTSDIEVRGDSAAPEGLEDFTATDMAMPRIRIQHQDATFTDQLSGESYSSLDVILLGLVKQRILWPAEPGEEKSFPMCRSFDGVTGHPDPDTFPWAASGFKREDYPGEHPVLNCAECKLSQWGSHPKNSTPWCSEQYTFPLLVIGDNESLMPAVLSVQRSSIKPCKSYLTSFARSRNPLYTCVTHISLEARRRGSVNFAVPKLVKGQATDESLWPNFAEQYRDIREFLQTPTVHDEDEEGTTTTPAAPAAASSTGADEDLPF